MPRVQYIEKDAASPELKKLYEGFESQFGIQTPNVVKARLTVRVSQLKFSRSPTTL